MFATQSKEPIIVKKEMPVRSLDLFNIIDDDKHETLNAKIIHRDTIGNDSKIIVFLDQQGRSLSVFVRNADNYRITCTADDALVDGVLNLSTMKYTRNKNDFKNVLKPLELSDTVEVYFSKDGDSEPFDMNVIFANDDKIVGVVSDLENTIVEFSKSNKSECGSFELEGDALYRS